MEGNTIYGGHNEGLQVGSDTGDLTVTLKGNEIYENKRGAYIWSYRNYGYSMTNTVYQNNIHDNTGIGLEIIKHDSSPYMHCDIRDNDITGNGSGGLSITGSGNPLSATITLNRISGNGSTGIYCQTSSTAKILYNNILNNGGAALFIKSPEGSVANFNNFIGNTGTYDIQNGSSNTVDGTFNLLEA